MFQNGARAFFCFFSTFHLRNSRLFKLRAHEGRFEGFQMRSFTFYLEGEQKKTKNLSEWKIGETPTSDILWWKIITAVITWNKKKKINECFQK